MKKRCCVHICGMTLHLLVCITFLNSDLWFTGLLKAICNWHLAISWSPWVVTARRRLRWWWCPKWWWCPSVSRMTQVMRMMRRHLMLQGKGQLAQQRQVVHRQGVQNRHKSPSRPPLFVVFPGPESVSHLKLCTRHLIQLWPRILT